MPYRRMPTVTSPVSLALALTLALSGCRQATPPVGPTPPAAEAPGDRTTAGAEIPAASAPSPSRAAVDSRASARLTGRVIAMAALATSTQNQAVAIDPTSGTTELLWTTEEGGNVSDWSPAPSGLDVAYRMIQRSSPLEAVEAIVVRGLQAGAAPLIVAGVDTSTARLAGFVWAPEGRRIAYLRRSGGLPGGIASANETGGSPGAGDPASAPTSSGSAGEWVLHVVEWPAPSADGAPVVPSDQKVWTIGIDPADTVDLVLVGWDPASGRAALAELAGDSGLARGIRLVDTGTGTVVQRFDVSLPPANLAASPDGRWLALPESDASPPGVRLLELATGKITELATFMGDTMPGEAVWAPDASWLAWPELSSGGAPATVRVLPLTGDDLDFVVNLDGANAQPLAFAPDGSALLVGAASIAEGPPERLVVATVPGGAPSELSWPPPADAWALSWVR